MKAFEQTLEHPTQASRVRLNVFALPEGGFLVTEDRIGAATVVATLGLFDARDAALERARSRAAELEAQRYRAIPDAA
jgi:hypothetical protein